MSRTAVVALVPKTLQQQLWVGARLTLPSPHRALGLIPRCQAVADNDLVYNGSKVQEAAFQVHFVGYLMHTSG